MGNTKGSSTNGKLNTETILNAIAVWDASSEPLSLCSLVRATKLNIITVRKRVRHDEEVKKLYREVEQVYGKILKRRAPSKKKIKITQEWRDTLANNLREKRYKQGRIKAKMVKDAIINWNMNCDEDFNVSSLGRSIGVTYQGVYITFKRLPELKELYLQKLEEINAKH